MENVQEAVSNELRHYFVELDNSLSSKVDFLVSFLESNYGLKTGIFCPLPSDVDLLEAILRKKGLLVAKLVGHVSFAKVSNVFEGLNSGSLVGVLLTDISSKHVDLSSFDYLVIFSPSADPSIYYQRSGLATGTTPRVGIVSLVATQDLVNFQYLKKATNLNFEPYSNIRADISENREKILKSLISHYIENFNPEERVAEFAEKLLRNDDLLRKAVPLFVDTFLRNLPSETDRGGDVKDSQPRARSKISVKEARIFINLGKNHQFTESALKALLDQALESGAQHLIRVSIRLNYSFFDVVDFICDELIEKLNGISWNGNRVAARLAIKLNPLKSEVGKLS